MFTMLVQIILCMFLCTFPGSESIDCPSTLPVEIEGNCYKLVTERQSISKARDYCQRIDSNAVVISVRTKPVLDKIEKIVNEYVTSNMESAEFWIGFLTDDTTYGKAKKDRNWKWDIDDTEVVQKDYGQWENGEGPTKDGLTCGVISERTNYLVYAIDCGGARLAQICMKPEGEVCKDKGPPSYMMYNGYCLAAGALGAKRYEAPAGCQSNYLAPYKNESMRIPLKMAAINTFLGGGLYMNMIRDGDRFIELSDGKEVNKDWWEPGEPRGEYDCVGLSLQVDKTLKYKTMDCEFHATFFCAYNDTTIISNSG